MFETMGLQIQYLLLLQNFREVTHGIFDGFFMCATWLGETIIPLSIICIVYWGINKKAGTFLLFNFGLTLYVNVFLKMTACIKRPWLIDSRITPLKEALPAADGYSFPSGHTAGATAVWGSSAYFWWNKKFIRYLMITVVCLVAFSRNYVGVHTPQDVIVSIFIGICLMFGIDRLLKWIEAQKGRDFIFYLVLLVLTVLLCIYIHIKCCLQMQTYDSANDLVNPIEMKHGVYAKIAFMFGIFSGWLLEKNFVNFEIKKDATIAKWVSIILGILVLYILTFYMNKFLIMLVPKHIASAIIAFLTALYITFLYPIVLKKYKF